MSPADGQHLQRAIALALQAEREGNLPVGAVLSIGGRALAEGRSAIWAPRFDATRHAEMEALRAAPANAWAQAAILTMYTTLEPCLMCLGAILLHPISRVVFGSADGYGGAGRLHEHLPPYFRQRFAALEWLGPVMPAACDPLRQRLREIETGRVAAHARG